MSKRKVSFDIETRLGDLYDDRPVLMANPIEIVNHLSAVELGTLVHALFELINKRSVEIDEVICLYPHEMHLAPQFPGRPVHEIEPMPIDFAPIERRVMAYMDEMIAQDFIPRPIDFDICDVVAQMKTELKALPHEPHRTYDWQQRLPSRRRRRK